MTGQQFLFFVASVFVPRFVGDRGGKRGLFCLSDLIQTMGDEPTAFQGGSPASPVMPDDAAGAAATEEPALPVWKPPAVPMSREERRQKVADEILSTERTFVEQLLTLQVCFVYARFAFLAAHASLDAHTSSCSWIPYGRSSGPQIRL